MSGWIHVAQIDEQVEIFRVQRQYREKPLAHFNMLRTGHIAAYFTDCYDDCHEYQQKKRHAFIFHRLPFDGPIHDTGLISVDTLYESYYSLPHDQVHQRQRSAAEMPAGVAPC